MFTKTKKKNTTKKRKTNKLNLYRKYPNLNRRKNTTGPGPNGKKKVQTKYREVKRGAGVKGKHGHMTGTAKEEHSIVTRTFKIKQEMKILYRAITEGYKLLFQIKTL